MIASSILSWNNSDTCLSRSFDKEAWHMRELFKFLFNLTMVFMCICIKHVIQKYEFNRFLLIKFEDNVMNDN